METYTISFTLKGHPICTWERQAENMEKCLDKAKTDYIEKYGSLGGVFISRKTK